MDLVKRLVNRGYAWLEENPITALLMSAGLSGFAVLSVVGLGIYSQSTFVQKTACTRDPSSAACAQVRQEVARAEPIENPCISLQRVSGTKGRNCPRFFIPHRGKRQVQISSKEVQNLELGGEQPAPKAAGGTTGGMQPSKGGSTEPPAPGKGGSKGGGAPTNAPEPRSEAPTEPAPSAPAASPEPASPGTSASEAPGLIGNPGGAVGELACGAGEVATVVAGVRVCTK